MINDIDTIIQNLNSNLDCIYVLSGGMRQNEQGQIVPGDFHTLDHHGLEAEGESRCLSAFYLWQKNKSIKIISSGSVLPLTAKPDSPKAQCSKVYRDELIRLGIDSNLILESTTPTDTFTELISLVEFITNNEWKYIIVICNRAQINRTQILWDIIDNYPLDNGFKPNFEISVNFFCNRLLHKKDQLLTVEFLSDLAYFKTLNANVLFIPAEDIIEYFDPKQSDFFKSVYKSKGMKKRIIAEKNGISDILNGVYYIPKTKF